MEFIKSASQSVCNGVSSATMWALSCVSRGGSAQPVSSILHQCCQKVNEKNMQSDLWGVHRGSSCKNLIRFAGLSGSCAILLAAYGTHVLVEDSQANERRKRAFENASKHHLINSLALLLSHKSRCPLFTAMLFSSGMLLVCLPNYSYGIWNEDLNVERLVTLGSTSLLLGWLSFAL